MESMTITSSRRWLLITLILSLGGNMFLGGMLVSRILPRTPPDPPDPKRFVERLAATLSPADAEILGQHLSFDRDAVLAEPPMRDDLPGKIAIALRTEPFDPQALDQLIANHERQAQLFNEHMRKGLIAAASAMSPEGRRKMAAFRP
jgi:hypothetical protein